MKKVIFLFLILVVGFVSFLIYSSHIIVTQNLSTPQTSSAKITPLLKNTMQISSPVFGDNQEMPSKYTCDGASVNPSLQFSAIPANAKSLVLLMEDPDVPKNIKPDGMFDHWVVYNIDPSVTFVAEDATPPGEVGLNTIGKNMYTGACPPDRQHRYFFKLYALNTKLSLKPNEATKTAVEKAMEGHIIDQAQLIGLYERK